MSKTKNLYKGNCLDTLKTLPDCSIDSIVTDPPYELSFMSKSWDSTGIAYSVEMWRECLRVLKPGGHLLAFSGSRTYHRMTVAIEDAGFEIRDQIMWLYGSGFPKSLDVSKAIDKAAGAEREVVGSDTKARSTTGKSALPSVGGETEYQTWDITAPATPEAQQWQGWGTALKPAHEPICVARKPLTGTVASNVLEWGTGALNIDGSRVGTEERTYDLTMTSGNFETTGGNKNEKSGTTTVTGRWPANVIHDGSEEVLAGFPNDAGRFFYCAKASKSERNAGLGGLPNGPIYPMNNSIERKEINKTAPTKAQNFHPTVKPLALMRYLVKLVTPPGGTVLDPFLGSGSTAVAAILEGFDWRGCEMTEEYWPIIEARVKWAKKEAAKPTQGELPI